MLNENYRVAEKGYALKVEMTLRMAAMTVGNEEGKASPADLLNILANCIAKVIVECMKDEAIPEYIGILTEQLTEICKGNKNGD